MKKGILLILSLLLLSFFSCKKGSDQQQITFSGHLKNVNIDSIYLTLDNREKAFPLDPDGNFSDTVNISHEGYYRFSDGRNDFPIYLIPGDQIMIEADYLNLENSLKFTGTGAIRNNFLMQKDAKIGEILSDEKEFYNKPAEEFRTNLQQHYHLFLDDLKKIEPQVELTFYEAEKKNLHYQYLLYLYAYIDAYAYFQNKKPQLTPEIEAELKGIDINNEEDYNSIPSYRFLVGYVLDEQLLNERLPIVVEKIKSQKIKDQFLKNLIPNIYQNSSESDLTYETIQKNTKDKAILEAAEEAKKKLDEIRSQPSLSFSFPNLKNEQIELSHFAGKLVYIDLWATWCRPCFMEFPHLKKLAADYANKDIVFLGISIDKEEDKEIWKNVVKQQKFPFEQLFAGAENVPSNAFLSQLNIRFIPRFVLIGKDGRIISQNAPNPSHGSIRQLIDTNLAR